MNRQIKFRGKSVDGKWHYGDLLHIDGGTLIYHGSHTESDDLQGSEEVAVELLMNEVAVCLPDTIGQFTGLTDRNGTPIYEGDIIVVKGQYPRIVLWDKVSWALMPVEFYHDKHFWEMNLQHPDKEWWEDFAKEIEVIGNIHDDKIKEE